jgi:hypothetical protein
MQLSPRDTCLHDFQNFMPPPLRCATQNHHGAAYLSLHVDVDPSVPRQLILFERESEITWLVKKSDFQDDTRDRIEGCFQAAIDNMHLAPGLVFTKLEGSGHFAYVTITRICCDDFYACSFFPPKSGDLAVTKHILQLKDPELTYMFMHEIGHLIGLRHENAEIEDTSSEVDAEKRVAHLFFENKNEASFMRKYGSCEELQPSVERLLQILYGGGQSPYPEEIRSSEERQDEEQLQQRCDKNNIVLVRQKPMIVTKKF